MLRTTFELSTNQTTWSSLPDGQRIAGGWRVSGLALPGDANKFNIRARGFVPGTLDGGSAWFVETIAGPPVIFRQPTGRTNSPGTLATMSIWAGGTNLTYQWWKDNVRVTDGGNVSGSQTSTLTLSNVVAGDTGNYWVVITNASGSATSAVVKVVVRVPAQIITQLQGQTRMALR